MAYNDTTTASLSSENLVAAQILFDHKRCFTHPDRFLERYCQSKRNGGGDISVIIYPWEENPDKALVIFDAEYTDKDVVSKLAKLKKPPIQEILEFTDSQYFGLVKTYVAQPLLTRLLQKFTIDKLKSRIELETGIRAVTEQNSSRCKLRLVIKGFFFQIKLAETFLNRLANEIEDRKKTARKDPVQSVAELDDPSAQTLSAAIVSPSPIISSKKEPLFSEKSEKLAKNASTDSISTPAVLNANLQSTLPHIVNDHKTTPSLPHSVDLSKPSTTSRNNSKSSESDHESRIVSKMSSTHEQVPAGEEPSAGDFEITQALSSSANRVQSSSDDHSLEASLKLTNLHTPIDPSSLNLTQKTGEDTEDDSAEKAFSANYQRIYPLLPETTPIAPDPSKTQSATSSQAGPSSVTPVAEHAASITLEKDVGLVQSPDSSLNSKSKCEASTTPTKNPKHLANAAAHQALTTEVSSINRLSTELVKQQTAYLNPECEENETVEKRSSRGRRPTEEEDEFDKYLYEFMKIIHAEGFNSKILEKFEGTLTESEHPNNDQYIVVTIKSYIPGEAERMMDALVELFDDVTKSVYSRSIKLNYDGDKQELAKALVDQLRDPQYGFIVRLSSNDEIRIIGSPANKDEDVQRLESYISYYKKKKPAQPMMPKKQLEIKLPNGTVIDIMLGDLTKMKTDAVVSSSGANLAHKRGVSKAIAIACGPQFQAEGKDYIRTGGSLKEGSTFVQLAAGELANNGVRYVIHAIAPTTKKGADVQQLLVRTIRKSLKEAEELKCRTIAFPAICAGVMGVPIATCGLCYWVAMAKFSSKNPDPHLKKISFVVDNSGFMLELYNILADLSGKGKAGASNQHQQ
ncbi:uncharacterized protein [Watersipora subatra]|uniref:uncharacterized protein n=1 Tax=Watersipora subatra TaxID=2589382 RepID=UPI00355BA596